MLKLPFNGSYEKTQEFNDKRYRASYTKFGILGHNGWDFATPSGTIIVAPHAGKVVESSYDAPGYGWYVKIENEEEFSVLAHFKQSPKVKVGAAVQAGDAVGLSGSTGNSSGPHLHWGYGRYPRNRDNGFNGYIDQTHWMDLEFGNNTALEKELDDMRVSRNEWRDRAKKAISEGRPLSSYTVTELATAVATAIKEGRWK